MGGNALKNINCIRININLYNTIKNNIISKLSFYNNFISIIEMPGKESFGDLDLMYEYKDNINIRNIVNELFSPKEIVSNGDVLSFSYKINEIDYFQIDLIKVMNIDMGQFFYGYGGCGLIIGNILKKNNLTFGQNGLWINYENYKIILSDNAQEICNFIQLDYNKWKNGFNNKKELFDWIIKCKYFNKDYFNPEKFNHQCKKIYEKRIYFKQFVDYILNSEQITSEQITSEQITPEQITPEQITPIKLSILDYIIIFNKQNEKDNIDNIIYLHKLYQEKFNGRMFIEYIDATKINEYKNKFKKYISINQDFNTYLIKNDIEFINNEIKIFLLNNFS